VTVAPQEEPAPDEPAPTSSATPPGQPTHAPDTARPRAPAPPIAKKPPADTKTKGKGPLVRNYEP
jgi:hypothetical protein